MEGANGRMYLLHVITFYMTPFVPSTEGRLDAAPLADKEVSYEGSVEHRGEFEREEDPGPRRRRRQQRDHQPVAGRPTRQTLRNLERRQICRGIPTKSRCIPSTPASGQPQRRRTNQEVTVIYYPLLFYGEI